MIKIEITESAFMHDVALLKGEVERFRVSGFDVWLDDFGSEYSTLNLLQDIDFDLIKIDMQFMKNLSTEGKNFIIVSDIIDMARRMGITTLIEGVETREHYLIMQKLGCEKIQGFLFNRPNPLDYIVQRALSSTGLTFETPDTVPYYEAIGRVDLNAPMSQEGRDLPGNTHIYTGILECRENGFTCLRATEHFQDALNAWLAMKPRDEREGELVPFKTIPDAFNQAVKQCREGDEWVNFSYQTEHDDLHSVYIKRLSALADGRIALLAVLLRNREKYGAS